MGHLYKDCPLNASMNTETSKGTKLQSSVEQKKGEQEQDGPPAETAVDATKKKGSRCKGPSSPPRTRSKSAEDATSLPGNHSSPFSDVYFTNVMLNVLH